MKTYKYFLKMLGLIILASVLSGTASGANNPKSIILYYKGAAQPNTAAQPTIAAFQNWCQGACIPTTQLPLLDSVTGSKVGAAYAWAKDYTFTTDYLGECFSEFVEYKLPLGIIYTQGIPGQTCGAFMDPALVKPVSNPQALVAAAGGKGNIVSGTGLYRNIQGTYTVRVWAEVLNGSLIYYNYTFINLMLE